MERIGITTTKINITPSRNVANMHSSEAAAIIESLVSNACHTLGDGDGFEATAIIESLVSNACHTLGDGDGGQAAAIPESPFSNACHAIGLAIIGDRRGDSDCSAVFVIV